MFATREWVCGSLVVSGNLRVPFLFDGGACRAITDTLRLIKHEDRGHRTPRHKSARRRRPRHLVRQPVCITQERLSKLGWVSGKRDAIGLRRMYFSERSWLCVEF
jgi:hypothetical protein